MRTWIFLLAGSLFFIASCKKQDQPLNVLLIAIDDLNDYTGFMEGHPQASTPHMDRLASESMVFRNAFCATAECNPSRAAMLTGYHPKTTGFTNNFLPVEFREWSAKDEVGQPIPGYTEEIIPDMANAITMPQWFRSHGYYTMGCGKVFHNHSGDHRVDKELSWNEWSVAEGNDLTGNVNRNGIYDGKIVWVDWGPEPVETHQTADYRRAAWAAEQIRNYNREEPFFLAVGFKKPHDPFYAPPEFFERIPPADEIQLPPIHDNGPDDNDLSDIPYKGRIMADKKDGELSEYEKIKGDNEFQKDFRYEAVRAYLATTAFVDSCVGVVMDALNESPYRDNTVIVLWSDHGWHLGEKLHYHKFTHWDNALRNLLVIDVPGMKRGYTNRVVNAIDIFPTLVETCGLPTNYLQDGFEKQGISLIPLLRDPEAPWCVPSLTSNFKRYHPMTSLKRGEVYSDEFMSHSIRTEHWKLIEYIDLEEQDIRDYELYDLSVDPEEFDNLAANPSYADILDAMKLIIRQHGGGPDGPRRQNVPPVVILNTPPADAGFQPGVPGKISVEVIDIDGPDEISSVIFKMNGKVIGKDRDYPFEVEITPGDDFNTAAVEVEAMDIHGESMTFSYLF